MNQCKKYRNTDKQNLIVIWAENKTCHLAFILNIVVENLQIFTQQISLHLLSFPYLYTEWCIPWNNSCTATYPPSLKLSKQDKQDMWDTAWEAKDEFKSDVHLWTPSHRHARICWQQELTYSSSVQIQDVVWKIC